MILSGRKNFHIYKELLKYSQIILDKKIKQKNEYYTSNILSYMIDENHKFKIDLIKKKNGFV
jgi:hypothetical protein